MTIDLDKFSKPVEIVAPIINHKGVYKRRKFEFNQPDGFYWLRFGDKIEFLTKAVGKIETDRTMDNLPAFRGIAYGNSIIPLNFSSAKFLGYDETIPVHFMNAELGTVIVTRRWEDGRLLFHEVDMGSKHQLMCIGVKEKAEKGEAFDDIKGVTPEMRYFYILLTLDKQRIEEWQNLDKLELSKIERERRIKKFEKSFAGRLQKAIEGAGGKLVKFNRRGDRVDVSWIVGDEIFHSVLNQNFRVLELGFCAEGHDKDHSISSAVLLAEQFVREHVIHRTRE